MKQGEKCRCGREDAWNQFDGHGIYLGLMCDKCVEEKFRPDIREQYFDPTYAGESLEPDE